MPTLVTILVPHDIQDRANGMVGTVTGVSFLVTSVISGVLVGLGGLFYIFIMALSLTVVSIIDIMFITYEGAPAISTTNDKTQPPSTPQSIDLRGTLRELKSIPGLIPLILFSAFNNLLGGVFYALMDAYGLSLVSVQSWGFIWGLLSTGFIIGGILIAKFGLGSKPLRTLFIANGIIWGVSALFTIQSWLWLLMVGMFIYLLIAPFIEAAEQTIIQRLVPFERQGRVFGFAQSVEQAASPITAFVIGPIAQFVFIPFMTTGAGVGLIGGWFGTGPDRGIALLFTLAGIIGLMVTVLAVMSPYYRQLSKAYQNAKI